MELRPRILLLVLGLIGGGFVLSETDFIEVTVTQNVADTIVSGIDIAKQYNHTTYEPIHIVAALAMDDKTGKTNAMITAMGGNIKVLKERVENELKAKTSVQNTMGGNHELVASPKMLELHEKIAKLTNHFNDTYGRMEHLIMVLCAEEETRKIMSDAGLTANKIKKFKDSARNKKMEMENLRKEELLRMPPEILAYSVHLTDPEENKRKDPVVGRDREIQTMIEILLRRVSKNPILVGEPGVGKTAAVRGLAMRIASGDVPNELKKSRIFALDLGRLVAGSQMRGEFEKRLTAIIDAAKKSKDIIIFIDEIHRLIGSGKSEGSPDAANMLKPPLSEGDIRVIGATTHSEYEKHILIDPALARRFSKITIEEPDRESTISMMRGMKRIYEDFHGFEIEDAAIIAAVDYAIRYCRDKKRPDSVLTLVDGACSYVKIQQVNKPKAIDELEREITQLSSEVDMLSGAHQWQTAMQLKDSQAKLASKKELLKQLYKYKETEAEIVERVTADRQKLGELRRALESAEQDKNKELAEKLKFKQIPAINAALIKNERELQEHRQNTGYSLVRNTVDVQAIEATVETMTRIPIMKPSGESKQHLANLEARLKSRVMGQDVVVKLVTNAILVARMGLSDPTKPYSAFLFLGPSGVGKTEMAKAVAAELFNSESRMIRFDMSEYQEALKVALLIGTSPGYVGYENGGLLTDQVRREPYSVILFDEIEKGHKEIYSILLQILDEGTLKDNRGVKVCFCNTLIILTSNLGSQHFQGFNSNDEKDKKRLPAIKNKVMEAVRGFFSAEMIGRFKVIHVFDPLNKNTMREIMKVNISKMSKLISNGKDIEVKMSNQALDHIMTRVMVSNGAVNTSDMGARPLSLWIHNVLKAEFAMAILEGALTEPALCELQTSPKLRDRLVMRITPKDPVTHELLKNKEILREIAIDQLGEYQPQKRDTRKLISNAESIKTKD